jgi:hypothetical protein
VVRALLIRGMLAGLIAGLLAFGFGKVFGEPQVDRAIAFEAEADAVKAKASAAKGMPAVELEPVLVSRTVQASLGLFTGVVVYSTASGGLFALIFALVCGRVGQLSPRAVAVLLATGAVIAVTIVPGLKYPASPPSVGEPETIGIRTAMYFLMILISVTAMAGAVRARQSLARRLGGWNATLSAAAGYLVVVSVAQLLLPAVNEVPDGFPAELLWQFRMVSLGMQMIMWTAIGLLFGGLAEPVMATSLRLERQVQTAWR